MNSRRIAIGWLVWSGFVVGGLGYGVCAAENNRKPVLSAEATEALARAESSVDLATAKKALWTTAASALVQAQEAAKQQDDAAVMKYAAVANEQAALGMAQLDSPLTSQH
ncbi:MAG: hypothetical protein J0I46_03680 [Thiobacillus sp.]|uniref:hypothetical protein n=1 Tax=unclassified Thiobacillus TaxID=2646513 RepID=UPI00086C0527|nr:MULTISPECIES: hypothetical protein [unclassified Thiobacillus]MBN8770640.1 hypothetical protein [Thiobacillus sp.]MBN8780689.1 hypothetical protein [Thiobacillus sp.]ODU99600.1 MAG: hypothetical protein ABT23_13350 [Thiobacillus sp. SCN 63-57]OJY57862.1 MAG: hypothetical protein BGP19_02315 [Thiobacillus sp. 0-1251]